MRASSFFQRVASMTADEFIEFVASVPAEKQVGMRNKLAHLLEDARTTRIAHGLNLDPLTRGNSIGTA